MNYLFRSAAAALLLTAVFSMSANAQFVVEPPVVEPPTPVCNECDGKIDNIIFFEFKKLNPKIYVQIKHFSRHKSAFDTILHSF